MRKLSGLAFIWLGCTFVYAADWLMHSGDPQRSGWQKAETSITKDNVKGLQLLWKLKLDNQSKALHSLMEPLVLGRIITNRGFKELVVVAGSSDNIYAVDADLGKLFWKKHFDYTSDTPAAKESSWLCPGGLTATPVISPPPSFGGSSARNTAARNTADSAAASGRGAAASPASSAPAGPPATARPAAPARRSGGSGFGVRLFYALSSDGNLHSLNLANGEEMSAPSKFLPPNAKPYSLNIVDNVVYATSAQHCGGNPNGVWALDLDSPEKGPSLFASSGGGLWGRAGAAIGTDGTVYAEVGDGPWDPDAGKYSDTILALTPRELKLKDYYTPTNREWITKRDLDMGSISPVVFPYKGRDLIVGAGKEGRLYLLDSKSLGGDDHRTALYRSELLTNEDVDFAGRGFWGSFATWEDAKGTRWVYVPAWGPLYPNVKFPVTNGDTPNGSIMAFKVEEKNGKPVLSMAWISRDMNVPEPPVIANGIVFAISSGEFVRQAKETGNGGLFTSQERAEHSTHAILYALDAETGKELYSSGDAITSFTHFGGLAIANGRLYLGTFDNTLYSFGFPMEH
jgi:outer membrane protein assembly factor BamB